MKGTGINKMKNLIMALVVLGLVSAAPIAVYADHHEDHKSDSKKKKHDDEDHGDEVDGDHGEDDGHDHE